MEKPKRNFKGVWIDKDIWLNQDLTIMEKVFLVEINSLDGKDGCFASNNYFSDFFNLTRARCSQIINSLKEKGFITITYEKKGKEIKKRTIRGVVNILSKDVVNFLTGGGKFSNGGWLENFKDNNTNINNTNINKNISYVSSKQTEEDHPSNSNFNGKILRNKKPSNKQKKVVSFKTISKDQFELFYKRYPRKINKGKAKDAWNKLCNKPLKERPTLQDLLKAVSKQSKTSRWQEIKFIPHPATWLNQSRWMDEVEPMNEIYTNYPNKRIKPNNGFQTDGSVFRRVTKNAHISN